MHTNRMFCKLVIENCKLVKIAQSTAQTALLLSRKDIGALDFHI